MGNTPTPSPDNRQSWQFCVGLGPDVTPKRRRLPENEVPKDIKPGADGRFING